MPRYRFEFFEAHDTDEVSDILLRDDAKALLEARRTAVEIFRDGVLNNQIRAQWAIKVYEEGDRLVGTVYFKDFLTST